MSRNSRFHALLREAGIAEPSPTIPHGVGRHIHEVVFEEDLHKVPPNSEEFRFPEPTVIKLEKEEMRKQFTESGLKTIAAAICQPKLDYSLICGRELDVPIQFPSASAFVHFKKALATSIREESKNMGIEEGVLTICKHPPCMNATVPNFEYCITHLSLDPNYEKQKFVHTCNYKNGSCSTPCALSQEFCPIHRLSGK
jgi:hypothetical protein